MLLQDGRLGCYKTGEVKLLSPHSGGVDCAWGASYIKNIERRGFFRAVSYTSWHSYLVADSSDDPQDLCENGAVLK